MMPAGEEGWVQLSVIDDDVDAAMMGFDWPDGAKK